MKTLHIHCSSGIGGDMFAAACLDAGLVALDEMRAVPRLLGLDDVEIREERVQRSSIAATHLTVAGGEVRAEGAGKRHAHTHYERLDRRLAESGLGEPAKSFAREVFRLLAEAEASAHGRSIDHVVFHEVGTVDSIVDVALAGLCVEKIAADRITAIPVPLGRGHIQIAHGQLAVPPPATAHLVAGLVVAAVPSAVAEEDVELTTPTGAAILRALRPTFVSGWPNGAPRASGLGAGSHDLAGFANVLRVVLLDDAAPAGGFERDRVVEITCNLDDQTAERTGWAAERLLEMGALDVWVTAVMGKKGRPASQLSLLAPHDQADRFLDWILRHTSTFGVRYRDWDRWKLIKRIEHRPGPDGKPVAHALGLTSDGTLVKEKPEYDDVSRYWGAPSGPADQTG